MRVLIADDERGARQRLCHMLEAWPDMELVGEASDPLEALHAISTLTPDAIFLNIQMPGLDGFELISALPRHRCPAVVFVTAQDEQAVRAFETSAADYLLKPVDPRRLARAVDKLRRHPAEAALDRIAAALSGPERLHRVVGKRLHKLHVLPVESIEAFLTEDDLVFALTADGRFLVEKTLDDLEAELDPARFVRVHRQAIVNLAHLKLLEPITRGGATARLTCGESVEISRRHAPALKQRMGR
jgi:two-component system, LytTR family, response regulator